MKFLDFGGQLLPADKPEAPTLLQERLEGRQVARMDYLLSPNAEWGVGYSLTSGARLAMWATRDDGTGSAMPGKYRWRIILRWLPPQRIWTRRMGRFFGYGRDDRRYGTAVRPNVGSDRPAEPPDDLQRRVEGEVIVGAAPTYEPNAERGEVLVFEFRGGGRLRHDALPPLRGAALPDGMRLRADMAVRWFPPPERRIFVPSERDGLPLPLIVVPKGIV